MRAPTKQSAEDEELDRLVLIGTNKNKISAHQQLVSSKSNPQTEINEKSTFSMDSNVKGWNCWIRGPNLNGQDLLFELTCLRKLNINGLACNEINFQRVAIGMSYSHYTIYKKIIIEIRFHRNFMENGFIFIEFLKKDSPLNSQTAKLLLNQLYDEANKQRCRDGSTSVLALVLKQLPSIIDSIHVFPPVNLEILEQNRISLIHDESECSRSDKIVGYSTDKESQCSLGYTTSPFDSHVPSPRLSGARFNQNGFLCLFGQTECTFRLSHPINDGERSNRGSSRNARQPLNRNLKTVMRMNSPHLQDEQSSISKKSTRLFLNRNESNQHNLIKNLRTLSEYTTQFMVERNVHDPPEMNHSFTVFNPDTRSRLESETRQRLSSVTLEDPASNSMIKSSKNTTLLSPIRRRRRVSSMTSLTAESVPVESQPNNSVIVLDTTVFQNVSRLLGQHYRIMGGSVSQICYHNMWKVVRHSPKKELISLWQILFEFFQAEEQHQMNIMLNREGECRVSEERAKITKIQPKHRNKGLSTIKTPQIAPPISYHPLDRQFMYYFIDYYYAKSDIQTAAILAGLLMRSLDTQQDNDSRQTRLLKQSPKRLTSKFAAYDKIIPVFKSNEGSKVVEQILLNKRMREPRSYKRQVDPNYSDTSLNNSFEQPHNYFVNNKPDINSKMIESLEKSSTKVQNSYEPYLTLKNQSDIYGTNDKLNERVEAICIEYSVILYQWGLLNQRAEILKCIKMDNKDINFKQLIQCAYCNKNTENGFCTNCEVGGMICVVCDEKCNGLITVCKICAHGGHANHMLDYFDVFETCPICGCKCRN